MNVLRQQLRASCWSCSRRTYATSTFVPPASLQSLQRSRHNQKENPASPTFYTGRPSYYDHIIQLETAITHTRHALTTLQLLPLPAFARQKLEPRQPVWKAKLELESDLSTTLSTARYRRIISLLNQLNEYQRIASTAGCHDLGMGISSILDMFERHNKDAILARGKSKPVKFDQYGRTYTLGKRKTSAARVWMIPVREKDSNDTQSSSVADKDSISMADMAGNLLGLESTPSSMRPAEIPTTNILLNNIPLSEYFAIPADRERILRPFKLCGVLGAYNVFALVRGGGTTGQSGAVTHAIAKGLAAHEPAVAPILRKAKLLRRDPRMVERKKTGLAKARKRYTWVKR